ncbi:MAG: MarR family winged helix-turn-helix transcriptional regulator [Paracoccaceae bacterium]
MKTNQHNFHGLLHSADLIEAELRRRLAPLGIQPRQARVLEAMGRMGPVSQSDLATAFGITSASMSTMTDRLLAAGYITRAVDPASRRQNALELTDKGRTLLAGIGEAWAAVDDRIRDALGTDAATLFDLARRLRDGLGGSIPGN